MCSRSFRSCNSISCGYTSQAECQHVDAMDPMKATDTKYLPQAPPTSHASSGWSHTDAGSDTVLTPQDNATGTFPDVSFPLA